MIGGMKMLGKILCFAAGTIFGVALMCVFTVAGKEDERMGMK